MNYAESCQAFTEDLIAHRVLISQGAKGLYGFGAAMELRDRGYSSESSRPRASARSPKSCASRRSSAVATWSAATT